MMHRSSKAGCILPWNWSVVTGADEFERGRTLEGEEEGRRKGTREHGDRGRRQFKRKSTRTGEAGVGEVAVFPRKQREESRYTQIGAPQDRVYQRS